MSRIVILGSGTALPDRERDNTHLVWETPSGALLIDCGGRTFQQLLRAGIDPLSLREVILTHAHPDHIYGLPALVFHLWLAGYKDTLSVRANAETLAAVQRVCDAMQLEQNGWMCQVAWSTLEEDGERLVAETAEYTLSTLPVEHSIPCLALKIVDRTTGRTLVYSSDTQPCAPLQAWATGAHTLIHEATTSDPDQGYGHSTPFQAGEIAARAGVQRLVLIHFSAVHTMPEADALRDIRAAGFQGEAAVAHDLAEYIL